MQRKSSICAESSITEAETGAERHHKAFQEQGTKGTCREDTADRGRISEKLDKLPDILKEDGYPDVQAFMATYREMEGVVERYACEVWEYNLKLKQKEKPAKKPPEKQSVREHLRQLQEQGKQKSRKKKSFDRDSR